MRKPTSRPEFVIQEQPPAIVVIDGQQSREISPLWLRERTQAPDQLEPMTQQRLFDSHAIDANLALTQATQVDEQQVALAFSDGHRETYDLRVLAEELGESELFPAAEP